MTKNYAYYFDPETRIMYKFYYGEIRIDDITTSWDDAVKREIIPKETIGFVLEYRKARLLIPVSYYKHIPVYYRKHPEIFSGKRIAILTTNPKDIVIPLLVETEDHGYQSKPFSTEEAAIKWIKKK
ncbi:MAG: hypothetical protein H0S84_09425 [Bacteroidales bacterium]|nr:hypothetical protein [Bacteroidales bacterium]MDN5349934.1 hypothetical protein [Bacteroidales bacterium]